MTGILLGIYVNSFKILGSFAEILSICTRRLLRDASRYSHHIEMRTGCVAAMRAEDMSCRTTKLALSYQ